jgi:hypothetical protein
LELLVHQAEVQEVAVPAARSELVVLVAVPTGTVREERATLQMLKQPPPTLLILETEAETETTPALGLAVEEVVLDPQAQQPAMELVEQVDPVMYLTSPVQISALQLVVVVAPIMQAVLLALEEHAPV